MTYYVFWTYGANFSSLMRVEATSPNQAISITCGFFKKDFFDRGTVFVFDAPPAFLLHEGKVLTMDQYRETMDQYREKA